MSINGIITRDELEMSDLDIHDPGTYRIVDYGPGDVAWRRQVVTSPYVHGEVLVGAQKEQISIPLTILVEGSSQAVVEANEAELFRALGQFRYELKITHDGVVYHWYCQPADWGGGSEGRQNGPLWRAKKRLYTFRIRRDPIPIDGSF